jgi:hypothetical protein
MIWINGLSSGYCGLYDGSVAGQWRLPNRKELHSLIDRSKNAPPLPAGHPFTNVLLYNYWSSSTFSGNTNYAWAVNMENGLIYDSYKTNNGHYILPVRGGE